jgi:hypothetical protein
MFILQFTTSIIGIVGIPTTVVVLTDSKELLHLLARRASHVFMFF